jgi:HK97 family phage portal protein
MATRPTIASSLYRGVSRVVGGIWSRFGGWGWSRIAGFLPGAKFDWDREAGDPWRNSIVALGISWLGDRFPRPRIQLCKIARNGDHIPQGRSDFVDLWNRPNPFYGRRTLEKALGLSLKVDGNAYLYKVRNRMGGVVELWWVPHDNCSPTYPSDGSAYVDGYKVWVDAAEYWIPTSEMIHVRDGIDPKNERLGLAALKANLREVCAVNMESSYTAALLKNSGIPGLAIVPESGSSKQPDDNAIRRVKERFRENFSGDNAGDPLVLAGAYKVIPIGFSPEQLAIDKLTQNAISRIASSIGVAPMSLGLPDPGKTYSNLAEANRSSWGTICSIQELIADEVRWQLLPDFGLDPKTYIVEYDYSQIQELQESLDAVHARTREDWKAGLIRLSVAQEILGYDVDQTDGDRYYPGTGSATDASASELGFPGPGVLSGSNGNGRARY